MSSILKVKITQIDNTWLNILLSHGSTEMILEASEISCSPIPDLINAVIYSCIYSSINGDSSEVIFDAEGVLFKLKLTPQGKELRITASFIEPKVSIDMPGNTALSENVEFDCVLPKEDALISFWRGIKEYCVKTRYDLSEISTIESAVTKLKAKNV